MHDVRGATGYARVQAVLATRTAAPEARRAVHLGEFEYLDNDYAIDTVPAGHNISPARNIGSALRGRPRAQNPFVLTEAAHSGGDDEEDDDEAEDGRREMDNFIVEDHDSDPGNEMEEANNASGESDHEV
jgi:hypothetical protein